MKWDTISDIVTRTYGPNATVDIQPYTYALQIRSLAAGNSDTQDIVIQANANFFLVEPVYRAWIDDTSNDVAPLASVLVTDTGSNQQYSQKQVNFTTFFGQIGRADYLLPYPRLVAGKSGLTFQTTNLSSALTYNIDISLIGVLVKQF